jgi:hypothetical protein
MEGHMSERLHTRESRILLLDFLLTELEAARIINVNKPDLSKTMEVQLVSVVFLICFDKFKTISVGIFAHIYVSE